MTEFSYCYQTELDIWDIYIPNEGIIKIIPTEHKATVNADATLNLERVIMTHAWQGYLRQGQFIPFAEFVG